MNDTNVKIGTEDIQKCAICLQIFPSNFSKSYTSKCFHSFCFECLYEWTKVKYSCPLCKTDFDRIIYDLNSLFEYKTYFLKSKENENLPDIVAIPTQAIFAPPQSVSKASWQVNFKQAPIEFRMLVYKNNWYSFPYQIQSDVTFSNIDLDQNEALSENLECIAYKPVSRFRDIRPEWFEKNPACTHRIMSFLNRELKAVSAIAPSDSHERLVHALRVQLISIIVKLLKKYDIKSDAFFKEISEHIRPLKYARHFQHELYAFAKSTSTDLVDYDAKTVFYKEINELSVDNDTDLNQIIPFKYLPVNISKYRLLSKEKSALDIYYDNYESSLFEVQASTSRAVEERLSSDSEQSSFCEIVTPPRKKSPPLINLESESDVEYSSVQSKSISSTTFQTETSSKRKSRSRSRTKSKKRVKKHKKESKHRKKSHKKSKKRKSKSKKKRSYSRDRNSRERSLSREKSKINKSKRSRDYSREGFCSRSKSPSISRKSQISNERSCSRGSIDYSRENYSISPIASDY